LPVEVKSSFQVVHGKCSGKKGGGVSFEGFWWRVGQAYRSIC
jgi:hypothetical protein